MTVKNVLKICASSCSFKIFVYLFSALVASSRIAIDVRYGRLRPSGV